MAITSKRVVQGLEYIKERTPVKFKSFGLFFLKLIMLSVQDQEFIVSGLIKASAKIKESDMIIIESFKRSPLKLTKSETQFRFILEHSLKCRICGRIEYTETNIVTNRFKQMCEFCYDKAQEYQMEAANEAKYD